MTVLEIAFIALLAGAVAVSVGIAAIVIIRSVLPDPDGEHEGADEAYGAELLDQRLEALTGEQTVVIDPVQAAPLPFPHMPDIPAFDEDLLSLTREWPRDWLEKKIRAAEERAEQAGLVTK